MPRYRVKLHVANREYLQGSCFIEAESPEAALEQARDDFNTRELDVLEWKHVDSTDEELLAIDVLDNKTGEELASMDYDTVPPGEEQDL